MKPSLMVTAIFISIIVFCIVYYFIGSVLATPKHALPFPLPLEFSGDDFSWLRVFFIGIGGTGSRCLESLVHFCASGLGPPSLSLGIVDQDQANGNVARSRQNCRSLYALPEFFFLSDNRGKNELSVQNDFMKAEIHTHQGDAVWCPLPNTASSLRKVFNYGILKPELKGLFDCLYSPSELDLFLEEGFRGKPHIGAAAILSNMDMESGFWRNIAAAINTARGGDDVNIFLAGSIFGGMGASGFPQSLENCAECWTKTDCRRV